MTEFLGKQDENLKFLGDLYKNYKGIMQSAKSIEQVWKDTTGDLEKMKAGQLTTIDMHQLEKNRFNQAENAIKDAGASIRGIQEINQKVMEQNKKTAEQSMKVEGLQQAVQTGIQATVNGNDAVLGVGTGLATLISINLQDYMEREAARVQGEATRDMWIDQARQDASHYDSSKNLYAPSRR